MAGQAVDAVPSSSSSSQEEFVPFLADPEDIELAVKFEQHAPSPTSPVSSKMTPIPKAQLASLCAVRLVDPIAFTQIFPYVNEMMEYLKVTEDHSKIGFYSGLVVGVELCWCTSAEMNLTSLAFIGKQFRGCPIGVHLPLGETVW